MCILTGGKGRWLRSEGSQPSFPLISALSLRREAEVFGTCSRSRLHIGLMNTKTRGRRGKVLGQGRRSK